MSVVTIRKGSVHVGAMLAVLIIYFVLKKVNQQYADVFYYITMAELMIYLGVYVVRFTKAAKRYNRTVADVYADLDGRSINWLNRILIMMLVFALSYAVLKIVLHGYYDNRLASIIFYPLSLIVYVALSWNVDQMRMTESIPYGDEQRAVIEENSNNDDDEEEESHVEGRELTAEQKEFMEQLDTVCTEGKMPISLRSVWIRQHVCFLRPTILLSRFSILADIVLEAPLTVHLQMPSGVLQRNIEVRQSINRI